MGLFAWLWDGLKNLGGLILPVFAKARAIGGKRSLIFWFLHIFILGGILAGLGYINYRFELGKFLEHAPAAFLRKIWLPLLFFLVYCITWVGWWLWKLLRADDEPSAFADIDEAWADALKTLQLAGIEFKKTPVFLVLGKPAAGEQSLFHAAGCHWIVDHAPRRPDAALHLYANQDSIFVTCAGASLLGRKMDLLLDELEGAGVEPSATALPPRTPGLLEEGMPGELGWVEENLPAPAIGVAQTAQRQFSSAVLDPQIAKAARAQTNRAPILKDPIEAEKWSARLHHLCRLISAERYPCCPINGVLLLVPWRATALEEDAKQTGMVCRRDLKTASDVFQLHFPILAAVSDLEEAAGFRDFIERLPADRRHRRLGERFPCVPELEPARGAEMIESGVRWLCLTLIPSLVYRLLRLEETNRNAPGVDRGNRELYRFLSEVREREERLARLLGLALTPEVHGPWLLEGCYFIGTGREAVHQQAFVPGVFSRILEKQNTVSWTDQALADDVACRRGTRVAYLALGGLVTAILVTLALL